VQAPAGSDNEDVPTTAADDPGRPTAPTPVSLDAVDPVILVAQIAESLPALDRDGVERLADALDELNEAIGLRLDAGASDDG
jgi:hypothetical protein